MLVQEHSHRQSLISLLIWLDLEVLAKLFEADTDDTLIDRRDSENTYN
jgi:hypothetical protein